MTRKAKGWIIAGSIVGGVSILFAGFLVYAFTHFGRAGGVEQIKASRIGTRAYLNERSVVINKHKFIYYNVISSRDGEWILMDKSSYIINTDIDFGFRYKNAGTIILLMVTLKNLEIWAHTMEMRLIIPIRCTVVLKSPLMSH